MPLRRSEVIAAALLLLDEVGLDALSTRRLAARLDVHAGALYWHVASKQDLLDAIADKILVEVRTEGFPPGVSWPDEVRMLVRQMRETLLSHRDSARVLAGSGALGPNRLRIADHLMGVLGRTGAPVAATAFGSDSLMSYLTGFVLQEQSEPADVGAAEEDTTTDLLDADRYPYLAAWARTWSPDNRQLSFAAGLEIQIGGLERYLAGAARTPEEHGSRPDPAGAPDRTAAPGHEKADPGIGHESASPAANGRR